MSFVGSNILAGASGQGGGSGYQINRSLRFNSGDSSYLNRTPSSAGNRKTWTWAAWFKKVQIAGTYWDWLFDTSVNGGLNINYDPNYADSQFTFYDNAGSAEIKFAGSFRDPSAWYHIQLVHDTTQSTSTERVRLYVNGNRLEVTSATWPGLNTDSSFNNNIVHSIGRWTYGNTRFLNGYLADVYFIDGQALDPTDFGEPNAVTGVWQPKEFAGSYTSTSTSTTLSQTGWTVSSPTSENNIWDGNTSTTSNGYNGGIIGTVSFSPPLTNVTKVEVYQQNYHHYLNGSQVTTPESGTTWHTLYDNSYSPITLNSVGNSYTNNTQSVDIMAIRINGSVVNSKTWTPPSGVGVQAGGVNSFYLKFADNSSNAALGTDSSGNSNTWTVNNLTAAASGATSFSSTNVTNVSNILDGNTSTGAVFTSTNAVFDAVCNISGITQLEFLIYDGSGDNKGQMQYRVNGGSYVNASYNNTNNYVWNNATSLLTNGTLTSFGFKLIGSPNGGAKAARYTTSAGTFYITSTPTDEIDCVLDSPTNYDDGTNVGGNYCTLSPIDKHTNVTLSNGNLDYSSAAKPSGVRGTLAVSSGKWYYEYTPTASPYTSAPTQYFGFADVNVSYLPTGTGYIYLTPGFYSFTVRGSYKQINGTQSSTGWGNFPVGTTMGVALDLDNGTLKIYASGTLLGTIATGLSGTFTPLVYADTVSAGDTATLNFGATPFAHTPPSGYKALCTTNLPEPTIADPSTAFDIALWTGNNSTQSLTGFKFSPDLFWSKSRSTTYNNGIHDTVRGTNVHLRTDTTAGDYTPASPNFSITSFNSDGVTFGPDGASATVNYSGSYVGWAWDAGTSNTTITAGSLNSSNYNTSDRWRDDVAGTTYSNQSKTRLFDGNIAQNLIANSGSSLTFSPSGFSSITSLRVYGASYTGNANGIVINGTDYTSLFPSGATTPGWATIPETSLTSIVWNTASNGLENGSLNAIEVDGKILIDDDATPPSVPAVASTVRANPTAGISIVSYTGNLSANGTASVAHGLNKTPEFIITKQRNSTSRWTVQHKDLANNYILRLDNTDQAYPFNYGDLTYKTSSIFSTNYTGGMNTNGDDFIAYCFTSSDVCSVGSYLGNGSTDGPFVYTGFKVAWLMYKRTDAANWWQIHDTARDPYNVNNLILGANSSNGEATGTGNNDQFDMLSNGFKIRSSNHAGNASGGTYVYIAFSEHSFKTARAR